MGTVPAFASENIWHSTLNEFRSLMDQGRSEPALGVAERLLALAEADPGKDPDKLAMSLFALGSMYRESQQYEKALPLYLRLQKVSEDLVGPEHQNTVAIIIITARTYFNLGLYEKALPLQQRALSIYERTLGKEHFDTISTANNLAITFIKLGRFNEALTTQIEATKLIENTAGPEHADTASALNILAAIYAETSQHEEALKLHLRALSIREKIFGSDHPITAMSLNNLSQIYGAMGQYEKALPLLKRALAIAEKSQNIEGPEIAWILGNIASTYNALSQYEDAISFNLQALAVRENSIGTEHPDMAATLMNLASTQGRIGRYEEALKNQKKAIAILEKTVGPEHPDTAWGLNNLANIYNDISLQEMALPLYLRALSIDEKVYGQEHPRIAASLNNLSHTYSELAQYDKALPPQKRALAIHEKALGPEHPDTATSLSNLASTYNALAQHEKALPLHQRALAIREKVLGPDHPDTALSLNNVAGTFSELTIHETSLTLQKRALAIYEKVLGPEHPATATSLNNLAGTYGELGLREKSLPLYQRALAIREKALGPEHPDTAGVLNNLASTYNDLAMYDMALPLHQRALAIREKALGPKHPDTAMSLSNLSYTLVRMGHADLAITFLKSAINIYQNQREQISRINASSLKSYTDSLTGTYQALASMLIDKGLFPDAQLVLDMLKEEEQFEFIQRSSNADPRQTRIGYSSTEKQWMSRYRQIADRLVTLGLEEHELQKQAKIGLNAEQKQRQKTLADDLRVAQIAFDSFLTEMREGFARQGPAKAEDLKSTSQDALRELQSLLRTVSEDAVLLQYYVTDDKVGMLLTTQGMQLARSTTLSSKELNRRISEFRRMLRDPKSDPIKPAQALYQLLVEPVAADLEQAGAKTVMLSLDGALRYLPFAALHDGQRYLLQRWNLPVYTSLTRNRLRDAASPQWQAAGMGVTRALGSFPALPAVKAEMRSIIKTSGGGVLPGEVHLDEAFTAQRFKEVGQRPFQLLHVASHFQFSPGTEANSFLLLGDGHQLTLGDIRSQNFRFDHVDLLTLSACDTGLGGGRDAQGREIEGFGVIAQQQGAKAVLATLWAVADESTATLMADMYSRRQRQGLSKIEALQGAQASLLSNKRYGHPFYWAPFILMGNWK